MARRGEWTGGAPPYGFRFTADHQGPMPVEVDPDEAAVITRMFAWYLDEGVGTITIAARLNAEGLRQRRGGLWSDWQVRRLMNNPAVSGRFAYGRKATGPDGVRRPRSLKDWDGVVIGPHIPRLSIVSSGRWDAMLARMTSYNQRHGGSLRRTWADQGTLLFTGFARCGGRGGPVVVSHGVSDIRRKTGVVRVPRLLYVCLTKRGRGRTRCPGQGRYSQRKVEQAVLPAILRVLRQLDTRSPRRRRCSYRSLTSEPLQCHSHRVQGARLFQQAGHVRMAGEVEDLHLFRKACQELG